MPELRLETVFFFFERLVCVAGSQAWVGLCFIG